MYSLMAVSFAALAVTLWIEADKRRAVLPFTKAMPGRYTIARALGWVAAICTLAVAVSGFGFEKGVPIGIAALCFSALLILVLSAFRQKWHIRMGGGLSVLALLLAGAVSIGPGA